jgi:hypothetical protein
MKALMVLALASPVAAQSAVWVVDDDLGPGADFADIADAVAAAQAGDVVLIRPGAYGAAGPLVLSTGLTRVASAGSGAVTCGRAVVSGLPAGEELVVRGITFKGPVNPTDDIVSITANAGGVWFEECAFGPAVAWSVFSIGPKTGVSVAGSSVILLRSSLTGGPIGSSSFVAGDGLTVAQDASAYLYDCDVRGGQGFEGIAGGNGASVLGVLVASGTSFTGGQGAHSAWVSFVGCFKSAPGGAGLYIKGTAHELECSFQGGAGGAGSKCWGASPPGPPFLYAPGGWVFPVPGQIPRSMSASSPVAEGGTVSVSLAGAAGDLVFLGFTAGQDAQFVPALHGALLLSQPITVVPAGVLAPDGTLELAFPVGLLPPGVEGLSLLGQSVFLSSAGPGFLGAGASVVVTDSSVVY